MNILLAPHSDDEALFASIIIQRYKPLVMVVTDSFRQYESHGITAHERRAESRAAAKILGTDVIFLGVEDNRLRDYRHAFRGVILNHCQPSIVFAPALQGGHADHDTVYWIAGDLPCKMVIQYSTYGNFWAIKNFKDLVPTKEEYDRKVDALRCYPSQYNLMPYFVEAQQNPVERISELP